MREVAFSLYLDLKKIITDYVPDYLKPQALSYLEELYRLAVESSEGITVTATVIGNKRYYLYIPSNYVDVLRNFFGKKCLITFLTNSPLSFVGTVSCTKRKVRSKYYDKLVVYIPKDAWDKVRAYKGREVLVRIKPI